jgi:hypothetical protein
VVRLKSRGAAEMPGRGDEAALLRNGDENGQLVETIHRLLQF